MNVPGFQARIQERLLLSERAARLDEELAALRLQHKEIQAQIAALTPHASAVEELRARQAKLTDLQRAVAVLEQKQAARDVLTQQVERARSQIARWIELRRAEDAAEQARRLLDDLTLGVSSVAHVPVAPSANGHSERAALDSEEASSGLRLTMIVQHPLTGALAVTLRLWNAGAELLEARIATDSEIEQFSGEGAPVLSGGGGETVAAERVAVEKRIASLGETVPRDVDNAQRLMVQSALQTRLVQTDDDLAKRRAGVRARSAELSSFPQATRRAWQSGSLRRCGLRATGKLSLPSPWADGRGWWSKSHCSNGTAKTASASVTTVRRVCRWIAKISWPGNSKSSPPKI